MSRRDRPIVASVEDVDESSGNVIEGTDRYASSIAPSSPAKEQPNTSRTRREKTRRGSSSPITTSVLTDSDSTIHPRRDSLKKPSKDREKSVSKKALMPPSRPPVKHAKTTQSIPRRDDPSYYGLDPATITPAATRPRAQTSRPSSYSAPSRPPPSNARFYASQTPGPLPTPFPPPSWIGPSPGPGPGLAPVPPFGSPSPAPLVMHHPPPHAPSHTPAYPAPPPSQYFRPLESRFGSARPQSSMGFRPSRAIEYDDFEEPPVEKTLARRPSATRKVSKMEEDRRAMPPPRRPASARPTALAFRPPPSTPASRRVGFEDHEPDLDDPLFRDLSPLAPIESYEYSTAPLPFQPRPSFGDLDFDVHDYQTEVAAKSRRRNSYYGGYSASSGSAYEDKMRQATRYQDDVAGGPQMPLTAESLRKAGRSGASSRSTRSSGSNESEYRQSATTRTTRSTAPNDEDVTIRVKGSTVLKFGNTEMQCQDGAEINIISRGGNAEIRTGSDRSSYIDQDDRRTRVDIPSSRTRTTSRARSRARSFSRPYPTYDAGPDYDTYTNYAPLPPPYPEYPSSYSSRHADGYFGASPF